MDFDCTENSRPSALLDISAGHNLTPHKFDHFFVLTLLFVLYFIALLTSEEDDRNLLAW